MRGDINIWLTHGLLVTVLSLTSKMITQTQGRTTGQPYQSLSLNSLRVLTNGVLWSYYDTGLSFDDITTPSLDLQLSDSLHLFPGGALKVMVLKIFSFVE